MKRILATVAAGLVLAGGLTVATSDYADAANGLKVTKTIGSKANGLKANGLRANGL